MAEFTLPTNSKVQKGRTVKAPAGATRIRNFKIYRWNPEDGKNPQLDNFEVDLDTLRTDGLGRADQDQERAGYDRYLPPLLPRGHLRLMFDEYRRHQHAGVSQADR